MRLRTVSQDEPAFGSFWRASIRSSSKARSSFVNSTASVTAAIPSQIVHWEMEGVFDCNLFHSRYYAMAPQQTDTMIQQTVLLSYQYYEY